jgi:hypothetical protein
VECYWTVSNSVKKRGTWYTSDLNLHDSGRRREKRRDEKLGRNQMS